MQYNILLSLRVSYGKHLLTHFGGDPSDPEEPASQADRLLQRATDHPAQIASLGRLFDPIYVERWEVSDLLEHGWDSLSFRGSISAKEGEWLHSIDPAEDHTFLDFWGQWWWAITVIPINTRQLINFLRIVSM